MIVSLKISREQKEAVLSRYPSVKFFLLKALIDYADKILIEEGQFNIEKESKEYHDRCVLNGYDIHKRKMTQATKDKISKGLKATSKRQGWKGIPLLEETKRLIGLKHKGKILSQATKDAIGKGNRGKKRTKEQRENLSKAKTGQSRKLSKEHKKNIGLAHKGMTYKKRNKELPKEKKR